MSHHADHSSTSAPLNDSHLDQALSPSYTVTAPRSTAVATLTALAALLAVTTCRDDRGTEPRPPTMAPGAPSFATSSASGPVTLVGAGNIAKCGQIGRASCRERG